MGENKHWIFTNSLTESASIKMSMTSFALAIYFLFVLAGLLRRGRQISGPWWFLLRSFLPSWQFYHDVGQQPRLFFRSQVAGNPWSDWQIFVPRARFSPLNLFHNPENNLELLHQTLIDQLSTDIYALPDGSKVEELVSYQLANRLVRHLLVRCDANPAAYQFEIRLVAPLSGDDQTTTTLISPVMPWK
jgi:hypothetical protein